MALDLLDEATQVSDPRTPRVIGPSTVLADRYVVLDQLGEGGAGTVYSAFDRVLRAEVAVKSVGPVEGDALLRFKSEFRAVQALAHPNLIALGELFEWSGEWFYSMERVDGTSFVRYTRPLSVADSLATATTNPSAPSGGESSGASVGPSLDVSEDRTIQSGSVPAESRVSVVRRNGTLDEEALRHALAQLCDAVAVLHRTGQVHRDLKPGNVLVTRAGRVVVLDFGLSVRVGAGVGASLESGILGTPGYMAPEQAFGSTITPAADWYAVGVMLYESLTGRRPFVGKTEHVLTAKRDVDPPAPSAFGDLVPRDLESLAMALLARDPAARPNADEHLRRARRIARGDADAASVERDRADLEAASEIFVGRDAEVVRVLNAYAETRRKKARRVVLAGPSGIGKSAALREAIRRIETLDASRPLILHGRCYERERVAFNALDELVDVLTETLRTELGPEQRVAVAPKDAALLALVFPVLKRVSPFDTLALGSLPEDPIERKRRLFAALRELLTNLARRRNVVIALEDLQWADADSFAVLAECVREPEPPPLLLLSTARSELFDTHLSAGAEAVLLGSGAERVDLAPLTRDAALELASRLGSSDAAEAARVVDAAEGHPLFLELLARRRDARLDASRGGDASIGSLVRDALHDVASAQSPAARRLLEATALAGRPTSTSALRHAADLDGGELHTALRDLRSAKLVRMKSGEANDAVEPYHDQVRASVVDHLAEARRVEIHDRLLTALEAEDAEPEVLLVHCLGAGRDADARRWAERAGERASAALAFDQAAAFYDTAQRGRDDADPRHVEIELKRADALANAGRGERAARIYLDVAKRLPPERVLEVKQRAAAELIGAGIFEEGKAAMGEVMSGLGLGFPTTSVGAVTRLLLARAPLAFTRLDAIRPKDVVLSAADRMRLEICGTGATAFSVTDPFLGGYFASTYLRLAVKHGDAAHLAAALGNEATAKAYLGDDAPADALLARARAIASELDDARTSAFLLGCGSAIDLIRQRDLRVVLSGAQRSILAFRDVPTGSHMELRAIRLLEGNGYAIGGLYRGLDKVATANVAIARETGDQLSLASWLVEYAVSTRWLVADAPEGLEACIAEVVTLPSLASPFIRYQVALSSCWLALYRGEHEKALAELEPRMRELSASLALKAPILGHLSAWTHARARLAWAETLPSDRRAPLWKKATADIRAIREVSQTLCRGWAESLAAALAYQKDDRADANASLRRAIELFDECRARGYAASARVLLGTLLADDEGRTMRADGLRYLVEQGVKEPERFASVMIPGMAGVLRIASR